MNIKLAIPRDTCEMRQSQQEEQDQSQTTSDSTPIDRTGDARRMVTFHSTALDEESSREVPGLNRNLAKFASAIRSLATECGLFRAESPWQSPSILVYFLDFARTQNIFSNPPCSKLNKIHSYLLAILPDIIGNNAFSIRRQL